MACSVCDNTLSKQNAVTTGWNFATASFDGLVPCLKTLMFVANVVGAVDKTLTYVEKINGATAQGTEHKALLAVKMPDFTTCIDAKTETKTETKKRRLQALKPKEDPKPAPKPTPAVKN